MMIPQISKKELQDWIFLLEFKLNQQEEQILKMPFWKVRTRIKQLVKYYEEKNKNVENETNKMKVSSNSNSSVVIPRGK